MLYKNGLWQILYTQKPKLLDTAEHFNLKTFFFYEE